MTTISDSRSRRWLAILGALGGSVLLSACGTPMAPTPVEIQVTSVGEGAGRAVMSAIGGPNLTLCRYCPPPEIDPLRPPPNMPIAFSLNVDNTGDAPAGTVHIALHLVGADGRRMPVLDTDVEAPRPGATVSLTLRFLVPSRTPAGTYRLEAVLDPDNRIAESNETDNTWLSKEVVTVVAL